MPYIMIQTNAKIDAVRSQEIASQISSFAAKQLSKPESVVMTAIEANTAMTFGGSAAPAAYVEVKSIGFPAAKAAEHSAAFCGFLEKELGLPKNRVFIEFTDIKGALWGYNGGTC
ncbi:MAG: phenylpyruvate tautomerase MIF-related protein [Verrucomicrobiae bacterium]|nr:phenylpyruvate tautomerase MIF-related protein [Verrucomicrobiae bacterium]